MWERSAASSRGMHRQVPQQFVIKAGLHPARPIPLLQSAKFHPESRGLQLIQPAVIADRALMYFDSGVRPCTRRLRNFSGQGLRHR